MTAYERAAQARLMSPAVEKLWKQIIDALIIAGLEPNTARSPEENMARKMVAEAMEFHKEKLNEIAGERWAGYKATLNREASIEILDIAGITLSEVTREPGNK